MKKVIWVILAGALLFWGYRLWAQARKSQPATEKMLIAPSFSPTKKLVVANKEKSLFVPYWSFGSAQDKTNLEDLSPKYDRLIYFGVAANKQGIDRQDNGYQQLESFNKMVKGGQEKFLTLRLLNTADNLKILADSTTQQKIIKDSVELAQRYRFQGVVLDLELSVLPFEDTAKQVNQLVAGFYQQTQDRQLKLAVALYGDVFYRKRPYEVEIIANNCDEIMVMAYDFHKSYGEPGPNFPFIGKEKYSYDFQTMVGDYLKVVPPEKLSVIFGLYGYDWTLGLQGKPLKSAEAVTLSQIEQKFADPCPFTACQKSTDKHSQESTITYQDEDGRKHSVWYEDQRSAAVKTEWLSEQGIGNIAFWAHGYF